MATKTTRPAARTGSSKSRGFAGMSTEKRHEIASMGGNASALSSKSRRWTPEEARAAGRTGGLASRKKPAAKKPVAK